MRLNRGTIILLVVLVAIIGTATVLMNSGSGSTSNTASNSTTIQLFEGLTAEQVTSLTVSSNLSPEQVPAEALQPEATAEPDAEATEEPASVPVTMAIALDEAGIWATTEESTVTSERAIVQENVRSTLGTLLGLRSSDQFQPEGGDLAPFGLDQPTHEIRFSAAAAEEGGEPTSYRVRLGGKNPSGVNYYALFGDDDTTVYVITNASGLDNNVLDVVTAPPFVPAPTPTPVPVLNVPGPIFNGLVPQNIRRMTFTDNSSGDQLAISLDDTGTWIEENAAEGAPEIQPMLMSVVVNYFIALNAVDGLTTDNLDALGLAEPAFTLTAESIDGQIYTLRTGSADPTGSRVYALVNDFTEVVVLESDLINTLTGLVAQPPYVIEPIAEATAEVTPEATPEVTPEATESSD
jgi:hypothetical protein